MNIGKRKNENKMKKLLFIALSISACCLYSQNKTIKGRVITNNLETMPFVSISINDTIEVGKTDLNSFFQVDIPISEKKISFESVGLYPTTIEFESKCDKIEVVMMLSGARESISLRRAERQRRKRYKKLPEIHKQAFDKGIFETKCACYDRKFESFYLQEN
ncbi:MAG: hypothetical protein PSN34_03455 [Urechidicola sp.]|nr:hypothetical protein [Urechidicola sp.]